MAYQVFVSYAIEDKFEVAEKIVAGLEAKGIKPYFAGHKLKVGDSIAAVVSDGLSKCRYGILILSPSYTRQWTLVELATFLEKEQKAKKRLILPVWHKINYDEAIRQWPVLADRYALQTSQGIEFVVEKLCEWLTQVLQEDRRRRRRKLAGVLLLSALTFVAFAKVFNGEYSAIEAAAPKGPPILQRAQVEQTVKRRIADFESNLDGDIKKKAIQSGGAIISADSIISAYNCFIKHGAFERNDYSFSNGYISVTGKKNIKNIAIPVISTPYNYYDLKSSTAYCFESRNPDETQFLFSFALLNNEAAVYTIDTIITADTIATAKVSYKESIRAISGIYSYTAGAGRIRKQQISMSGYKNTEEYIFTLKNNSWAFTEVK